MSDLSDLRWGSTCAAPGESAYRCDFRIGNFSVGNLTTNDTSSFQQLDKTAPDPDVAGVGTVIAFAMALLGSTFFAICIHIWETSEIRSVGKKHRDKRTRPGLTRGTLHHVMDTVLVTWSDQQIVLGLAASLGVLLNWCKFSTYHFNIVQNWLVFCSVTHTNALLVHCDYVNPQKMVATIARLFLIICHTILAIVIILVSKGQNSGPDTWAPTIGDQTPLQMLPASCFNKNATMPLPSSLKMVPGWGGTGANSKWMFVLSLVLTIIGLLFVIVDMISNGLRKSWWSWGLRSVFLVANVVLGLYVMSTTLGIRSFMIDHWVQDKSETKPSYGQAVSLFVAIFTLLLALEGFGDAMADDEDSEQNEDGKNTTE